LFILDHNFWTRNFWTRGARVLVRQPKTAVF